MPLTAKPPVEPSRVELELQRSRLYLEDIESLIDIAHSLDPNLRLTVDTGKAELEFTDAKDLLELPARPLRMVSIENGPVAIIIGRSGGYLLAYRPSDATRGAMARIVGLVDKRRRVLAPLARWWIWAGSLFAQIVLTRVAQVPSIAGDRYLALGFLVVDLGLSILVILSGIAFLQRHTVIIPRRHRDLPSYWERNSTTIVQASIAIVAAVLGTVIGVVIGPAITSWLK